MYIYYQTAGDANAKDLLAAGGTLAAWNNSAILADRSPMPTGVGGDAEEVVDDFE